MICWGVSVQNRWHDSHSLDRPGGLGSPGLGGRGLHWMGGNAYLNYSRGVAPAANIVIVGPIQL